MTDAIRAHAVGAALGLALTLVSAPAMAQSPQATAPAAAVTLEIAGDVTKALTITPADLKAMPRTKVTVNDSGKDTSYEGVLVGELLQRAGAPVGRDLSGKAVAATFAPAPRTGIRWCSPWPSWIRASRATTSSSRIRSTGNHCSTIKARFASSRRTISGGRGRSACCSGSKSFASSSSAGGLSASATSVQAFMWNA